MVALYIVMLSGYEEGYENEYRCFPRFVAVARQFLRHVLSIYEGNVSWSWIYQLIVESYWQNYD